VGAHRRVQDGRYPQAALVSHAAVEVGEDIAARSAARPAGQAVACACPHSIGAANYALQAIHRATNASDADAAIAKERDWQYQHLLELRKTHEADEKESP
jgi:hypothetical protein